MSGAMILAAVATVVIAASFQWQYLGNAATGQCAGTSKKFPGSTTPTLSAGSCARSNKQFAALPSNGPLLDSKNKGCATCATAFPGSKVAISKCLATPIAKNRRSSRSSVKFKHILANPEDYEFPPEQQWKRISRAGSAQLWKNVKLGLCMELSSDDFFVLLECDPSNPNQQWRLSPTPPKQVAFTPPIAPCNYMSCGTGKSLDTNSCQCVCDAAQDCGYGKSFDKDSCQCVC
jgi:hypothetical protein